MSNDATQIIIVGAGIAGLTCARALHRAGLDLLVLEATPAIGGRLRTDLHDGFRLDRGFQVLQLAYPEARKLLDYQQLDLKRFPPGARIRTADGFRLLADPRRHPAALLETMRPGVGSLGDRLRLIRLAREVRRYSLEELFERHEMMARDFLWAYGFSTGMIEQFFVPFLAGICLDPKIRVTSRFLLFVLRMFAEDDVAVPALGMGEIPKQLAAELPQESIRCNSAVAKVAGDGVILTDGRELKAEAVILATPEPETIRLLGKAERRQSCREHCLYYAAPEPPFVDGFLILNGRGDGLINSVTVPSQISADYAPPGQALIAAVIPGDLAFENSDIEALAARELREWFGPATDSWHLLRHYAINHALPRPVPPSPNPFSFRPRISGSLFHCSEFDTMPSIQWALHHGEQTAEAVATYLTPKT